MKKNYKLLAIAVFCLFSFEIYAQTEWTGNPITFTKNANVDWTLEANQDRITNNVWITRKNNSALFNIFSETGFNSSTGISPEGTLWAAGSIADGVENLTFKLYFQLTEDFSTNGTCPPCLINVPVVVRLTQNTPDVTDDIYIDFMLLSWNEATTNPGMGGGGFGNPGGEFSYMRSTNNTLGIEDHSLKKELKIISNPQKNSIKITGINQAGKYVIYDVYGKNIAEGQTGPDADIRVGTLSKGIYFLKFENYQLSKFIKY